jgi:hypothetical protein
VNYDLALHQITACLASLHHRQVAENIGERLSDPAPAVDHAISLGADDQWDRDRPVQCGGSVGDSGQGANWSWDYGWAPPRVPRCAPRCLNDLLERGLKVDGRVHVRLVPRQKTELLDGVPGRPLTYRAGQIAPPQSRNTPNHKPVERGSDLAHSNRLPVGSRQGEEGLQHRPWPAKPPFPLRHGTKVRCRISHRSSRWLRWPQAAFASP